MSRVEAFGTGIKIESSDQSPFGGWIKVTCKLLKINNQECLAAVSPLTLGSKVIKCLRRERSSTFFTNQKT